MHGTVWASAAWDPQSKSHPCRSFPPLPPAARRDECFEQGMLPTTLEVLLRVHAHVLAAVAAPPQELPSGDVVYANWDVRAVLGEERQRVLRGAVLVFSRVFPLDRRPESHPLWQMAEHFGARCCTGMEPGVTHVVAAAGGTEKVGIGGRPTGRPSGLRAICRCASCLSACLPASLLGCIDAVSTCCKHGRVPCKLQGSFMRSGATFPAPLLLCGCVQCMQGRCSIPASLPNTCAWVRVLCRSCRRGSGACLWSPRAG
jgi:hypothetical protein